MVFTISSATPLAMLGILAGWVKSVDNGKILLPDWLIGAGIIIFIAAMTVAANWESQIGV